MKLLFPMNFFLDVFNTSLTLHLLKNKATTLPPLLLAWIVTVFIYVKGTLLIGFRLTKYNADHRSIHMRDHFT